MVQSDRKQVLSKLVLESLLFYYYGNYTAQPEVPRKEQLEENKTYHLSLQEVPEMTP